MRRPASDSTARKLRVTTVVLFVLLGVTAYLVAGTVGAGSSRTLLQSVGSFLLGTVVVSYAYQYFLGEETENRTVAKLHDVLEARLDKFFPGASRYGFNGFASEAPRRVFDGLGPGDELLWLDTYSPDVMLFSPKLYEAVMAGAHLRMLVIAPQADTTRMRAEEIVQAGYEPSKFTIAVQGFLDHLAGAARDLVDAPGRLEVRCYADLPCVPMYLRLRDGRPTTGVTGFFLTEPSFNAVHISWSNVAGGMLEGFLGYFEHKWARFPSHADSRPVAAPASP